SAFRARVGGSGDLSPPHLTCMFTVIVRLLSRCPQPPGVSLLNHDGRGSRRRRESDTRNQVGHTGEPCWGPTPSADRSRGSGAWWCSCRSLATRNGSG